MQGSLLLPPSSVNTQLLMTRTFSFLHSCINKIGLISGGSIQGNPRNHSTIVSLPNQGAAERLEKPLHRGSHIKVDLLTALV